MRTTGLNEEKPSKPVSERVKEAIARLPKEELTPKEELEKVRGLLADSLKRVRLMRTAFKGNSEDIARVCDMLAEKGYGLIAAGFHLGMLAICEDDCRIYCETNGFTDERPNE